MSDSPAEVKAKPKKGIAFIVVPILCIAGVIFLKLSFIFFVFLFPIAMLSRLFGGKSSLQLKKVEGNSYYFTRNHKFEAKDLKNTW